MFLHLLASLNNDFFLTPRLCTIIIYYVGISPYTSFNLKMIFYKFSSRLRVMIITWINVHLLASIGVDFLYFPSSGVHPTALRAMRVLAPSNSVSSTIISNVTQSASSTERKNDSPPLDEGLRVIPLSQENESSLPPCFSSSVQHKDLPDGKKHPESDPPGVRSKKQVNYTVGFHLSLLYSSSHR